MYLKVISQIFSCLSHSNVTLLQINTNFVSHFILFYAFWLHLSVNGDIRKLYLISISVIFLHISDQGSFYVVYLFYHIKLQENPK